MNKRASFSSDFKTAHQICIDAILEKQEVLTGVSENHYLPLTLEESVSEPLQ